MPFKLVPPLLAVALLAGCGTISERGGHRVDVLCNGHFEDMGTCMSAARRYCASRAVVVLHDYSTDVPPLRRLLITCK